MRHKITIVLIVVFLLGVVFYIIGSGVVGKLIGTISSFAPHISGKAFLPSLPGNAPSNGSKIGGVSPAKTTAPTSPVPAVTAPTTPASPINPSDIPAGYTVVQLSPFFHKIRIGNLSAGNSYSYGLISLSYAVNETTTIDVTGWQLKSNRGGEYIPTAVNLYDPSGLTPATDIFMKSGQTLNIYSSTSPFNLRLNKCIGYLQNANHFNPALPLSCPYVNQSDISTFTGVCQQYIYSLGSCVLPDMSNISIPQNDYACRAYLENLNYSGCLVKHVNDSDFLSSEWRVWMGSNVIDPIHDVVLLLDRNGLLVDLRTY